MEKNLIQHIQKGDLDALQQAFRSYFEWLFTHARQKGFSPSESQELIEDAFFQLWKKKEITGHSSLLEWLKHRVDLVPAPVAEKEKSAWDKGQNFLSSREKALIVSCAFEGLSLEEAASLHGIPPAEAGILLADALEKLNKT